MTLSESEIEALLYTSLDGEVIGLDEVQLLDPPPHVRIPALITLLEHADPYIAFQAAIVLAAWGVIEGMGKIEQLIDQRVHEHAEISPNRIYDYDNVYDELAYAAHLYRLTVGETPEGVRIFRKLLGLYGTCRFESRLKHALLKTQGTELLPDVRAAMERAWNAGHEYLASQLLPPLARWDPEGAEAWSLKLMNAKDPLALANVAEALAYVDTEHARTLLRRLAAHPERAIADQASDSLAKLSAASADRT